MHLLATQEDIWEARRRERARFGALAVELLKIAPRDPRARDLVRELVARGSAPAGNEKRLTRVLGWALRERDDVIKWGDANGHGARWIHRDWMPTFEARDDRARGDAAAIAA